MARDIGRTVAGSVVAGLVLAFLGPFGSFEWSIPTRLGFWILCMIAGACLHLPAYHFGKRFAAAHAIPVWIWLPLAALAAAVPMTLMVNGIAVSIFKFGAISGVVALYPYVVSISLPVVGMVHLLEWVKAQRARPIDTAAPETVDPAPETTEPARAAAPTADTPLLDSVPARIGKTILCLEMEDHYVRVHTDRGDALVHGRMTDFETELAGRVEGQRVHRSWWVARAAVSGWTQDGKTMMLTLTNGKAVPVARDRQAGLKGAGWLG